MRILALILAVLGAFSSIAQKIKYKEVFGLLSTNQLELAEPFLKQYLAEVKDNPNANLYMGIIYHEKALKSDILRNTNETINLIDSAVLLYNQAHKGITEKEIKKNEDYYARYSKRDLRTGKYGVKVSDVHFEIEKSIEALNERKDKVIMVKHYFDQAQQLYKRSNELYSTIQSAYPGEKELHLRADEQLLKNLSTLSARFDSASKAFDHYKISLGNIDKPGYSQTQELIPIRNFKNEGTQLADFYEKNVQVWDYKTFAKNVLEVVEKEVVPTREKLLRYDMEINKLKERLTTDSVSVRSDLTKLVDNLLSERLQKFDTDPLPLNILGLKVAKLEYESIVVENLKKSGTRDVYEALKLANAEHKAITKLDSLAAALLKKDIEEEAKNYTHFVSNTYSNAALLKGYVKTEKDFADREKRKVEATIAMRMKALNWLIAGADSIPLDIAHTDSNFRPLLVEENKYTAGINLSDAEHAKGYFYTITPSRRPDISIHFQVDPGSFAAHTVNDSKALATSDPGNNIYFVLLYNTNQVNEKHPVTVAKIYRSDGLSWSHNLALNFIPVSIEYLPDATDLLIKSESEFIMVLDKNGNIRQ